MKRLRPATSPALRILVAATRACGFAALATWLPLAASAADAPTSDELTAIRASEAARVATIAKVEPAVVAIYGNDRQGGGSGFLFTSDGLALTNFHVVAGAGTSGWGGLSDGKIYRWTLVGVDPGGDVAMIRLTGRDRFPTAPIGDSRKVRAGDSVLVMGNPFTLADNERPSISFGVVSGVERYQGGSGKNALVYGSCIQVDAAVNPGNSGGPLFNMAGEVIGIIGRGSFDERGRVNVGVGYAISSEQVKNAIPDLMATKLVQHGTLDAVFGDRKEGVVCERINLDSKIAGLGLKLGDRLISFDGQEIHGANEYLNHITTLPAGWPVKVEFEHEGERKSVWTRLVALPYAKPQPPRQRGPRKPSPEKPNDKKPESEKPDGEKPELPKEQPAIEVPESLLATEPGKMRDAKLNHVNAERILKAWAKNAGLNSEKSFKAIALRQQMEPLERDHSVRAGQTRYLVWSSDGRYRLETWDDVLDSNPGDSEAWDGANYWTWTPSAGLAVVAGGDAKKMLERGALLKALGALYRSDPASAFSNLELEGADTVAGVRAFRLRGEPTPGAAVYLWLSVELDALGEMRPRLLKIGGDPDGHGPGEAWVFDVFDSVDGVALPGRMRRVNGLGEELDAKATTEAAALLLKPVESLFERPTDNHAPPTIPAAPSEMIVEAPPPGEPAKGDFVDAITYAEIRTVKLYGASIGRQVGYASGIIVSPQGDILTAAGAQLGSRITVVLSDGSRHDAKLVQRNDAIQSAIVKIDAETPDYFDLKEKTDVQPGDWLLAVSNLYKIADGAEPLSVNLGVASLRTRLESRRGVSESHYVGDMLLFDAITSNPGAAGGAVVDSQGHLVGMIGKIFESTSTNTRLNYAVPVDLLRKFVAGELADESPTAEQPVASDTKPATSSGRASLGIRLFTIPGKRAPAYIDAIEPESPAERSGLKKDDLVLSLAGETVRNIGDYQRLVATLKPDTAVEVVVKRGSQVVTVTLTPVADEKATPAEEAKP